MTELADLEARIGLLERGMPGTEGLGRHQECETQVLALP